MWLSFEPRAKKPLWQGPQTPTWFLVGISEVYKFGWGIIHLFIFTSIQLKYSFSFNYEDRQQAIIVHYDFVTISCDQYLEISLTFIPTLKVQCLLSPPDLIYCINKEAPILLYHIFFFNFLQHNWFR